MATPKNDRSSRWLRALLRLFPAEFRTDHAAGMQQVFRDQRRELTAEDERGGVARLWIATVIGTLRTAPLEHLRILRGDAAYAVRRFRRSPGFFAVAALTVALGIGATTAVFSLVDRVLLEPLPYAEPERLVQLVPSLEDETSVSGPMAVALERECRAFDGILTMAGLGSASIASRGQEGDAGDRGGAERARRLIVSPSYFDVLGARPLLGRTFRPEDRHYLPPDVLRETPAEDLPVAPLVIGYDLWQRRFGGDRAVLGTILEVDGRSREVVGVMPADFRVHAPWSLGLHSRRDLWYLSNWDPAIFPPDVRYLELIARLRPGFDLARAQAELDAFVERRRAEAPGILEPGYRLLAMPLHREVVAGAAGPLLIVSGAVVLMLLIACANVAGLMLAGGASRQGELGIRLALGASRERLVRQLMTESLLLAAAGAALGVLIAGAALALLMRVRPDELQRLEDVSIDASTLGFAMLATVLSTLLFGLVPSLRFSGPRLERALRAGRRSLGGLLRSRGRGLLVASQVALCFTLVVATGLLVRTFGALTRVDPGFDPAGLAMTYLHLPPNGYPDEASRLALYRRLRERLAAVPGVDAAGVASGAPFDGVFSHMLVTGDRGEENPRQAHRVLAEPGFFDALGPRLLAGRLLEDADLVPGSPPQVVIDENLARRYWPDVDPVGRHLYLQRLDFAGSEGVTGARVPAEVIGVVAAIRDSALDAPPPETLYVGYDFTPTTNTVLLLRASADPDTVIPAAREALREIDDRIALAPFQTLDDLIAGSVADLRFTALLLGAFGVLGLLLAAVGLYGLLAHSVRRGTGEIGLRLALGAGRAGIVGLVVGQGLRLTAIGLALGAAGSLALNRLLAAQLYGVSPQDPITFAAMAALLLLAAALACAVPLRRALRVDPLTALRAE